MQYFSSEMSSAEIVKLYRKLAKMYHPDLHPENPMSTRIMQDINIQFDRAIKLAQRNEAKDRHEAGQAKAAKEGYTYSRVYNVEEVDRISDLLRQKIQEVIVLDGISIELCGAWIWITGDTRPVKDQIKAAGFQWAKVKQAWYFKGVESHGRGTYSMDAIRDFYGSTKFKDGEEDKRQQEKRGRLS